MTATRRSARELCQRRRELLTQLGMTREQLQAEAEAGRLTGAEFWVYEDIQAIEFLLGPEKATTAA